MKLPRLLHPFRNRFYQASLGSTQSRSTHQTSMQGFTLLELLVTALISSVIVSGLLYLTNELLSSDQRESNRTETQRDLQAALDYIGAELQEAVYVYENAACIEVETGANTACDGIIDTNLVEDLDQLPNTKDAVPVLAFWKQSPFPDDIATACANNTAPQVRCLLGHAYSLVVYAYSENANDNGPWHGEAGILRYEMGLTQASLGSGDPQYGKYVAPNENVVQFREWPPSDPTSTTPPKKAELGEPQILVDFVDNFQDDDGSGGNGYFGAARECPSSPDPSNPDPSDSKQYPYHASPNRDTTGTAVHQFSAPDVAGGVGGFYACVNRGDALTGNNNSSTSASSNTSSSYGNQDVIVYLRGNASGRSGLMSEESFLPVLETRQLIRGALNRRY